MGGERVGEMRGVENGRGEVREVRWWRRRWRDEGGRVVWSGVVKGVWMRVGERW